MDSDVSSWREFWREALSWQGSVSPRVIPNVILLGFFASVFALVDSIVHARFGVSIGLPVTPYEIFGAALGVVLVARTTAGYDRWWEARKLWGGIVNQSRNLALSVVAYGNADATFRNDCLRWVAAFSHVTRLSLRGEAPDESLRALLGDEKTAEVASAQHMPTFVALKIAGKLREALEAGMPAMAFHQADRERSGLIDHMGACERILKTPLAYAYSIKIRRFLMIFLILLPLALVQSLGDAEWYLVPFVTVVVAYPLLCLDQLGVELQHPFSKQRISHLPLDEICATIERNLLALN